MARNQATVGGHQRSVSDMPLRSITFNCEVPDEDNSEGLDRVLSRYSNDLKPALDFMKYSKNMEFKSFVKEDQQKISQTSVLVIPFSRKSESLNSQDKTRVVSHSGHHLSPDRAAKQEGKEPKFESTASVKTMEIVEIVDIECQALEGRLARKDR